jgi:DNA-binding NtrC family response regulator
VDVRVVAATNRDLAREVNRGAFREDLYYRLAVVRVRVPPLRERRDDIPLLVEQFVHDFFEDDPPAAERALAAVTEESWEGLRQHAWPGNVRELRNFIERTLAISGAVEELPAVEGAPSGRAAAPLDATVDLARPFFEARDELLARFERAYLEGVLDRHGGNIARAARAAGMDRMHFKRLLARRRT